MKIKESQIFCITVYIVWMHTDIYLFFGGEKKDTVALGVVEGRMFPLLLSSYWTFYSNSQVKKKKKE